MKLVQLSTKHVRGVRDGEYRLAPGAVVVTGGPRAGKTSLLRAIAAARRAVQPHESPSSAAELLASGAADGQLGAKWQVGARTFDVVWQLGEAQRPEVPEELADLFAAHAREGGGFELFSARRSLNTRRAVPTPAGGAAARIERYADVGEKYLGLLGGLSTAVTGAASRVAGIVAERGAVLRSQVPDPLVGYKAAVEKMCPSVRLIEVEPRERIRPLVWLQTKDGARIELADLSDSEFQGFLFGCAFTWLGLRRSLVLVDTPELHIHPNDHARFFRALCELGTDNQIIAATTSPAILASVAPDQIIDLDRQRS